MLRKAFLLVLFPVLVAGSKAAIDLTPSINEVVEDGITYREARFKTPEGEVMLTLSPGWTIRGQKQRAQITWTDQTTDAVIETVALQKPEPLDEAAITKFKQEVLAALPAGSTKVTTVNESQNSLMPGGNPSFEFMITYDLWGKTLQRSVLLVNGPQDRLIFRFTCLKADFNVLNTNFRRSLMTWRVVAANESPRNVVATASIVPPAAN